MSGRNNEELAKALMAMASGQVADDSESSATVSAPAGRVRTAVALSAPVAVPSSPSSMAPAAQVLRPWGPSLFVKQRLIPILLTLGVVCLTLGLLGYFVDSTSPYSIFAEGWFSFPFIAIGLIMLGLGIVIMLLVREELARKQG